MSLAVAVNELMQVQCGFGEGSVCDKGTYGAHNRASIVSRPLFNDRVIGCLS